MARIAVLTDVHANLPALRAALDDSATQGVDVIYFTGDAIGLGPYPAETLDLLLSVPCLRAVAGNHDAWFCVGMPDPWPFDQGLLEHNHWTHAQLDANHRAALAAWPYQLTETFEGTRVAFQHYGLDAANGGWRRIVEQPSPADLDRIFGPDAPDAALVCYGHHHPFADHTGRARYVNPGALGCYSAPVARYVLVTFAPGGYTLDYRAVPYDDAALLRAYEERDVPARAFIRRVFLPRP